MRAAYFSTALSERVSAAFERARTYDRVLILIAGLLMAIGVVLSMATSPAATARIEVGQDFYFAARQAAYALVGIFVIAATALLDARTVRRAGVILTVVMLPLCALAGLMAPEVKGASRWLDLGFVSIQPSELLKPGLVVTWAWMLSAFMQNRRFPGREIAAGLYLFASAALLTQPDIGQTALLGFVLASMLVLARAGVKWLGALGFAASAAGLAIYNFYPHARARVDAFLNSDEEPGYQVGRALDAIASGGAFGRGPGEGVVKRSLPDAHADFVYAVGAEEFGLLCSLGLIFVFGALAFRGLSRAARLNDGFEQLAAAGLVTLLVAQAAIHMAVNLSLLPAKGMTLPFVSFGGSSMLGSAIAFGFCLALLRNRPGGFLYPGRA